MHILDVYICLHIFVLGWKLSILSSQYAYLTSDCLLPLDILDVYIYMFTYICVGVEIVHIEQSICLFNLGLFTPAAMDAIGGAAIVTLMNYSKP